MHRCLLISEIIDKICLEIGDIQAPGIGTKTLSSLARVSKDFLIPASTVLWRNQPDGLLNLLKCLPEDSWKLSPVSGTKGSTFHILRKLSAEDWERPCFYAPFVHEVTISGSEGVELSLEDESYGLLTRSLQSLESPLLPNLLSVRLASGSSPFATSLVAAIGTRLLYLSAISCADDLTTDLFTLDSIIEKSQALRKIHIQYLARVSVHRMAFILKISSAITSLNYLQELLVDEKLTLQALLHLSNLDQLRNLRITHPLEQIPEEMDAEFGTFSSLQVLGLHVVSLDQPSILDKMRSSPLQRINATIYFPQPVAAYANLFNTLKTYASVKTLTHLCVLEHGHRTLHNPRCISSSLEPLLQFTALQDLSFRITSPYTIDDDFLERASDAWIHIRSIHLMPDAQPSLQVPPAATLKSLLAFAQNCSDLMRLALIFDARVLPELPEDMDKLMYWKRMTIQIYLGNSPIEYPEQTATFLSSIFWDVETYPWTHDCKWAEVKEILMRVRKKRAEECDPWTCPHNPSHMRHLLWDENSPVQI